MSLLNAFASHRTIWLALIMSSASALSLVACNSGRGQNDPAPGEPCGPAAADSSAAATEAATEVADGGEEGAGAENAQNEPTADPLDDAGNIDDDGLPGFPYGLSIDPDMPTRAWFTIERGLLVSDDGGVTWEQMQTSKINSGRIIVALRPPGGELLVAGPGVLRRSEDDGETWIDMPGPLASDQGGIVDGTASESGDEVTDEGGEEGGDASDPVATESAGDTARNTSENSAGDPSGGESAAGDAGDEAVIGPDIRGLTADPSAPATLHALMGDGTVQRSEDAGATWTTVGERAPAAAYGLWPVAASPTVLWTVSLNDRSVCRSDDGGEHWARVEPKGLTGQLQGVTLASDGVAYAATIAGLFRSEDGGTSWEGRGPFRAVISAATQRDNSDNVLVILFGGSIFRSEDGGLTWGDEDAAGGDGEGDGDGASEGSGAEPTGEGGG